MVRTSAVCLMLAMLMVHFPVLGDEQADNNVTTITEADILREKPADIIELLRSRVGLDDSGGAITMRGVRGVVLYLDGFPSSMTEIKQVKPEQIEKITIMRGAASAQFGADAMGGAIVVTTRKRAADSHVDVVQGVNSSGSRFTRLIGARQAEPFSINVLGEENRTDGYKRVPDAPYPYQITVEDEHSEKRVLDAKLGFQGDDADANLNLKHIRLESFYGRPNWWEDYAVTTLRLSSKLRTLAGTEHALSLGYERYTDEGLRDRGTGIDAEGLAPDRFLLSDGSKYDAELATSLKGKDRTLRVGIRGNVSAESYAIQDYATRADTFRLDAKIANAAAFALYETQITKDVSLEISGRYDHYWYYDTTIFNAESDVTDITGDDITKSAFNPKLSARWNVNERMLVSSSVGTGFIPPTPDQLYYSDINESAQFLANPDLKSQRSITWDLGIKRNLSAGLDIGATLFYTLWTDKIGVMIVDYGTPLVRQYQNIGEAESKGLELQLDRRINDRWSAFLNYTYNATEITENAANPALVDNELPDMPRHKGNLGVTYERAGLVGRALVRYVGASYTDESNTETDSRGYQWRKDDYYVLDVSLVKRFKDVSLTLAIDNLLDEDYVTGFFWRSEGRVVRGEVAVKF